MSMKRQGDMSLEEWSVRVERVQGQWMAGLFAADPDLNISWWDAKTDLKASVY
jgi:hypothetical protein